jgi:two-component sensor histidine kinase
MPSLPKILLEQQRLDAVRRYEILDTAREDVFDHITALAAQLLRAPIALLSIVDRDRIWLKSCHGLDVEEIGRDPGFCASCILQEGPWIVGDARTDPRAAANPLVVRFGMRFYLGVPLRTNGGLTLGALSVLDFEPREVTEHETSLLTHLAVVVMDELELRLSARQALSQYHQELARRELREDHIRALLRELAHRSKNLLAVVLAVAQQTVPGTQGIDDYVVRLSSRVRGLALTHDLIADEDWKGATLNDLAARQLEPFVGEASARLKCKGPPIMLSPMAAQNIGLALHELATNAVKYGALSAPRGTVFVAWQHNPPRLSMSWREQDGPSVSPPTQKGFGHTVLARLVPEALDGEGVLSFNVEGFRWILDIPARHIL